MNLLNKICSYWYECIKNEDVLEKDISINVRSKAVLYPFDDDPFIFNKKNVHVEVLDEKLEAFASAKTEGLEFFYGYPLLFYRDKQSNKDLVAPLLVIKVKFDREGGGLFISKDEVRPTCGIQALTKLGLRTEEIANINQTVESLFSSNSRLSQQEIADKVLNIISKEANLSINEKINPGKLSNSERITKEMTAGLYNKSMIFAGETTVFNIHLIKDLLELKDKDDLEETALSFFFKTPNS